MTDQRVLEVQSVDNTHGGTQRVIVVNEVDNTKGGVQRVQIVGGGGGTIEELNVTPTTSAQTITASGGTDGYSPVNVAAVTSSIDANISAGNIKKDVTILGVTGSYEGTTPTGTLPITSNGTYDVTNYANADVQVPTTAPAHYVEKTVDANGKLRASTNIINLNGVSDVGDYALSGGYYSAQFPLNTSVDLSSLTTISGNNACQFMFGSCTGLTSVDLSALTTISGNSACGSMFSGCPGLKSVDLSALTTINVTSACQSMFGSCSGLKSVDLSALTTISGGNACMQMFNSCTGLTSVDLSALTTISGNSACGSMFSYCTGLTSVNLNGLNVMTAQLSPSFSSMFTGCTHLESVTLGGLTASTFASAVNQIQYLFNSTTGSAAPNGCTVHFPSNFDPSDPNHTFDASTLAGYPTFGGNASYIHVAFDLPASE